MILNFVGWVQQRETQRFQGVGLHFVSPNLQFEKIPKTPVIVTNPQGAGDLNRTHAQNWVEFGFDEIHKEPKTQITDRIKLKHIARSGFVTRSPLDE
jgi:hypothetical protein